MLTMQEVYDKVCNHLTAQGRKAVSLTERNGYGSPACLYRAANGNKCAAGCLILDKFYFLHLENKNVGNLLVLDALLKSGVDVADPNILRLVSVLQGIHDFFEPEEWKRKLIDLGEEYKLEIPDCLK